MQARISTGLPGLDEILSGGIVPEKAYLLCGGPGTGKSTIGYRYLEYGAEQGEKSLLITLSESQDSAVKNAQTVNIDLSDVSILDLSPEEQIYKEAQTYDVFPASEIESVPFIESIVEKIEEVKPDRVLLDSVTMLKYLHQDPYQYRNMILSFIRYICNQGSTVLMISETHENDQEKDRQVAFWVDGIIDLKYSPGWRKIEVTKFRGSNFRSGDHSLKLTEKGPEVFSRIQPNEYKRQTSDELLSLGIEEMDELLKGGVEKGSINLITGPTGVGKTSLGVQLINEAARDDVRSVIYTFEESKDTILKRSKGINIDIDSVLDSGNLKIVPVEPLSYSPDEFANIVRQDIEENDTEIVMIDSVSGFNLSFKEEEESLERLHALTVYLQNMGVTGIIINEVQDISGNFKSTDINASYLADNILFLKYVELNGAMKKIIGVLKKRLGDYEHTIREFRITKNGIQVGDPMTDFQGLLTGTPTAIR